MAKLVDARDLKYRGAVLQKAKFYAQLRENVEKTVSRLSGINSLESPKKAPMPAKMSEKVSEKILARFCGFGDFYEGDCFFSLLSRAKHAKSAKKNFASSLRKGKKQPVCFSSTRPTIACGPRMPIAAAARRV
jgi:hypothetical protein